jgi:tRNA (guanine26-N2/guanine27-N2)-dimethyltransferase
LETHGALENKVEYSFPTETIVEGKARFIVPRLSLYAKGSSEFIPSKSPVFYNPLMRFNRDLAVLALKIYQRRRGNIINACDPLTGSGVRGIRFALEVENVKCVVINDVDPLAYKLSNSNVELNDLSEMIKVENTDANELLSRYAHSRKRFDLVDLDPYGSPSPFLDSSLRSLRRDGLIALTATDMAPLCGVNSRSCIRKYSGRPLRTEYCHELAVRLLLSALVFSAARQGLGLNVLLSHYTDHYIRAYAQVKRGSLQANESLRGLGYITHCFHCLNRKWITGFANFVDITCDFCGGEMRAAGPLWLGKLSEEKFCSEMLSEAAQTGAGRRVFRLLEALLREGEGPPTYYVIDKISSKLGIRSPSMLKVMERLVEQGFHVTTTHFNPRGIKSNASVRDVFEAVREKA